MADKARKADSTWAIFVLAACYLVFLFLWRILLPGGAWPPPPMHYASMGLDILLIAVVFALRFRLSEHLGANPSRATFATVLFWCALGAGFGSLLIRFTSESAWWTGHLS
ncbi:MAG: hypothetical protein F9K19_10345 [Rhizobiaceae bacterium]|nr:MAG: hypothetical protein F9K19_10345 [Rhizobiaceae bacterium]CAG0953968.1 hypothetical protein RHIZO_00340 [Rhizobiaceae bacterium]